MPTMRLNNKFWWFLAIPLFIVVAIVAATVLLFWQQLTPEQRVLFFGIVKDYFIYFFGVGLFLLAGVGFLIDGIINNYVIPVAKVTEEAAVIYSVNAAHRLTPTGGNDVAKLIGVINEGAQRYEDLKKSVDAAVQFAKKEVEEEKNLLAGLMAEFPEGVIVCNRQGQILLYNKRVIKLLVESCTQVKESGPQLLIGLGRSVSDVIDEHIVSHALNEIGYKLEHGESPVASHFVITGCENALLGVEAAPILDQQSRFNGFILLFRDITAQLKADTRVASLLQGITRSMRASLASIRSAIEAVIEFPDMDPAQAEGFKQIIHTESVSLSRMLEETGDEYSEHIKSHWPLVSMRALEIVDALSKKASQTLGLRVDIDPQEMDYWIKVDSYAFVLGMRFLLQRLDTLLKTERFLLKVSAQDCLVCFDLSWDGEAVGQEQLKQWQQETITIGQEVLTLTMGELLSHHEGEIWSYSQGPGRPSGVRLVLPAADTCQTNYVSGLTILPDSRPEFFDFDLFHQPGQTPDLDNRALGDLSYTVFDTETTGLDPRGGDEIIAIGAVPIINGRILRKEGFDQLIDPQRALPVESTRIHGLHPEMLEGQPTIDEVLPSFHQFTRDTILVAHNAAFDMQMLKMKEGQTGVRFINPVLDTLLLSAVVHPAQEDHSMEAMAGRLGVNIVGRHTALGDALSTAELFLKLVPLLLKQGIVTLKEARLASQKTYYARLKY